MSVQDRVITQESLSSSAVRRADSWRGRVAGITAKGAALAGSFALVASVAPGIARGAGEAGSDGNYPVVPANIAKGTCGVEAKFNPSKFTVALHAICRTTDNKVYDSNKPNGASRITFSSVAKTSVRGEYCGDPKAVRATSGKNVDIYQKYGDLELDYAASMRDPKTRIVMRASSQMFQAFGNDSIDQRMCGPSEDEGAYPLPESVCDWGTRSGADDVKGIEYCGEPTKLTNKRIAYWTSKPYGGNGKIHLGKFKSPTGNCVPEESTDPRNETYAHATKWVTFNCGKLATGQTVLTKQSIQLWTKDAAGNTVKLPDSNLRAAAWEFTYDPSSTKIHYIRARINTILVSDNGKQTWAGYSDSSATLNG